MVVKAEKAEANGSLRENYRVVKVMAGGSASSRSGKALRSYGPMACSTEERGERWHEYFSELFMAEDIADLEALEH